MFGNLVESASHAGDVRRKSSFFLLTLVAYTALLSGVGIASIYAYDAHLEQANFDLLEQLQSPEDITFVEPEDFKPAAPATNSSSVASASEPIVRQHLQASTDMPRFVNDKVSNTPSNVVSLPDFTGVKIGNEDRGTGSPVLSNTSSPFGRESGSDGGRSNATSPPPPPLPPVKPSPSPTPPKKQTVLTKGVVNGLAISKPEPPYPPLARQARISGVVVIQILIDEQGKVINANVVNGHPMLRQVALDAARRARFTPTMLSDVPVKVQGTITYNFKLE